MAVSKTSIRQPQPVSGRPWRRVTTGAAGVSVVGACGSHWQLRGDSGGHPDSRGSSIRESSIRESWGRGQQGESHTNLPPSAPVEPDKGASGVIRTSDFERATRVSEISLTNKSSVGTTARILGVDDGLVAEITECNPYYRPKTGFSARLFIAGSVQRSQAPPADSSRRVKAAPGVETKRKHVIGPSPTRTDRKKTEGP